MGKGQHIEEMFASIAERYDLLNTLLSFNCHKRWRRFAVRQCALKPGDQALDVCAGTLDLAIELSRTVGPSGEVVGVDFCRPMLEVGLRKLSKRGIENISAVVGSAERLPVESDSFQAATIGFALRNVESIERTIGEMARAVESGGRVVCLELAKPEGRLSTLIHRGYSRRILPFVGGLIGGTREPYEYLPKSMAEFRTKKEIASIMEDSGLIDIQVYGLTGGVVSVHVGVKR